MRSDLQLSLICIMLLNVTCFFSNQAMLNCFHSKMDNCESIVRECVGDVECEVELNSYADCQIEAKQGMMDAIFNGYCFRKWRETARKTVGVVECLEAQCQIATYNNRIGLKELYQCSEAVLVDHEVLCEDECLLDMDILGERIRSENIEDAYQIQMRHPNASRLVEIVRRECIDDGEGKLVVEREWVQKNMRKYREGKNRKLEQNQL